MLVYDPELEMFAERGYRRAVSSNMPTDAASKVA